MLVRIFALSAVALLGACGGGSSGSAPSGTIAGPSPSPSPSPAAVGPNVVFIVADDLNMAVQGYEAHPQAYTPNLKRLMARGVTFRNAQANSPTCSPSRASFLSGYLPSTTGNHQGAGHFRSIPRLANAKLIPEHFRDQGYAVYGAGKVMHPEDNRVWGTSDAATQPTEFTGQTGGYVGPRFSYGPWPWDGKTLVGDRASHDIPWGTEGTHWRRAANGVTIERLPGGRWNNNPDLPEAIQHQAFGYGRLSAEPLFTESMNSTYPAGWSYAGFSGALSNLLDFAAPAPRDRIGDERVTDWGVALLSGATQPDPDYADTAPIDGRNFMFMMGLTKTHPPYYIPDEYFDGFLAATGINSIDDVALPPGMNGSLANDDLADVPASLYSQNAAHSYKMIMRGGAEGGFIPDVIVPGRKIPNTPDSLLRSMILTYLVAVYSVDYQLGRILDAIDSDPKLRDNTIIVFISDHGVHLGEKMSWFKLTHYNQNFGIPLVIVDPRPRFDGSRGQVSNVPVSLVDLYPTLVELADLPPVPIAEGAPALDGASLVPALLNPASPTYTRPIGGLGSTWAGYGTELPLDPSKHNYTWRTQRYRYTLSSVGEEELFDYNNDPYEYRNVANEPAYASVKAELKAQLRSRAGF